MKPPAKGASDRQINAYLDGIDRLLLEDPRSARDACEALPDLVGRAGRDVRARAFSSTAIAHLKLGSEQAATSALELAQNEARHARPATRALVYLRKASLFIRTSEYEDAKALLVRALELAHRDPIDTVLGRVHLKLGALAFETGDFASAAECYALALNSLPTANEHAYLRDLAAWNLILSAYNLDQRQAPDILRFLNAHGLKCRKPRAKSYQRPTVPQCTVCWFQGYLAARMGSHRMAIRCLSWAAETLCELGALREATLCALDLVSVEPEALAQALPIVETMADDFTAPAVLRQAARAWLLLPRPNEAQALRALLLETRAA